MYAIIESGGKQFRVEEGGKLRVAALAAEVGAEVTLDKVLLLGGAETAVGTPYVENAKVTAQVVDHGRGDKILVFKKWRRNDSRCLQGHRQNYTTIKITSITA
ncbi:MAG: 50S ribosomal protein L21 [Desulfovibrio sp.]|jgi:large subunit ribosomal protein L21|nr:50S ribosomal protein L21 [Desulfovibrio sp.]